MFSFQCDISYFDTFVISHYDTFVNLYFLQNNRRPFLIVVHSFSIVFSSNHIRAKRHKGKSCHLKELFSKRNTNDRDAPQTAWQYPCQPAQKSAADKPEYVSQYAHVSVLLLLLCCTNAPKSGASSPDFGSVTFRIRLMEVWVKKDAFEMKWSVASTYVKLEN